MWMCDVDVVGGRIGNALVIGNSCNINIIFIYHIHISPMACMWKVATKKKKKGHGFPSPQSPDPWVRARGRSTLSTPESA